MGSLFYSVFSVIRGTSLYWCYVCVLDQCANCIYMGQHEGGMGSVVRELRDAQPIRQMVILFFVRVGSWVVCIGFVPVYVFGEAVLVYIPDASRWSHWCTNGQLRQLVADWNAGRGREAS